MGACSKEDFRNGMVEWYMNHKKEVLGWANKYSPILNVTDTVMEVDPTIEEARLTIWGDPGHVGSHAEKLKIIGPLDKRIELKPVAIVRDWMQGIELENQTCLKDNKLYAVMYPCKLEVKKPGTGFGKWTLVGLGVIVAGLGYLSYKKPEVLQMGKGKLSTLASKGKELIRSKTKS